MADPRRSLSKCSVILFWGQFGPYHRDRCLALADAIGESGVVTGIQVADRSPYYEWAPIRATSEITLETLFPGQGYQDVGRWARFRRLVARSLALRARHVFLCHFEQPEYFFAAVALRLAGRRVYIMQESKFDDKRRRLLVEFGKSILYLPYIGALVGGRRSREYLRFLGWSDKRIAEGYDTISVARIQRLAGSDPAPEGTGYEQRHFTVVARFLPKKNLGIAIAAYALYRERIGSRARRMVVCGSGPLDAELRAQAEGCEGIQFAGFLQEEEIARTLATSLAIVLPSIEEQWGLVVNEALAMGVPALVSDNVGARDTLVRTAVTGYVYEPDNAEGLSRLMERIATDEQEWYRLSAAALATAEQGDVARFVTGALALMGITASGDSTELSADCRRPRQ